VICARGDNPTGTVNFAEYRDTASDFTVRPLSARRIPLKSPWG